MAFSFGAAKPATPAFGGFSAAPSAPATSPSLFGAAQPDPTSLFGQQPAKSLFGAPAPTPSLFGAPQPAPSLFGSQPGSLFGAQPGAAAPSLFGAPQQPATSSLFSTPPAAPSLFGAPHAAPLQSSLFGTPTPAAAPAFSFGQSQSAASNSLFAPSTSTSLFQSQPAQPQTTILQKLGSHPPSPPSPPIETRLEKIKDAWDPNSPHCRFQTYFYNVVAEPNTVAMYGRPPGGTDEGAWKRAVRENPQPDRLVPALAVGFPAVQKRIEAQTRMTAAHQASLAEISSHLATLSTTHSLETSLRTLRASQNALVLSERLMRVIAKLAGVGLNRNTSLRKEEEELRVALEGMRKGVERDRERVGELWSRVGALKARVGEGEKVEWAVADEEGLRQILEILSAQQTGLGHLTKTLTSATEDVDVMKEAFGMTTPKQLKR